MKLPQFIWAPHIIFKTDIPKGKQRFFKNSYGYYSQIQYSWFELSTGNGMKRTLRLKENLLTSDYGLCLERIRYLTEIYKANTTDPEIIKRAKAIAHVLKNTTIFIRSDELLVGNETSKNLAEKFNYDLYAYRSYNKRRYKRLRKRKIQPFQISDTEIDEAMDLLEDVSQENTQWSVLYDLTDRGFQIVMGRDYGEMIDLTFDSKWKWGWGEGGSAMQSVAWDKTSWQWTNGKFILELCSIRSLGKVT